MDTQQQITTIITLVGGGGITGCVSIYFARRGQAEEATNARLAQEAANRLAEAQEDRALLSAERAENQRLRDLNEKLDASRTMDRERAEADLVRSRERWDAEREAMRTAYERSIHTLTDDLATLREVARVTIRDVAGGAHTEDVDLNANLNDDMGV